nr:uncharacterized protein CTRU02_10464 [Colletotrichum truncatum]KAF6787201.1 hypothetical protein CTRU02_10464 [Colletotrichum truncatum]
MGPKDFECEALNFLPILFCFFFFPPLTQGFSSKDQRLPVGRSILGPPRAGDSLRTGYYNGLPRKTGRGKDGEWKWAVSAYFVILRRHPVHR